VCSKKAYDVDFEGVHCGVGGTGLIAHESLPFTQLIVQMHRCTFLDSGNLSEVATKSGKHTVPPYPEDEQGLSCLADGPPTSRHKGL